jgi:hypothetical protein
MDLTMQLSKTDQSRVSIFIKSKILPLLSTPISRIHGSLMWAAVFLGAFLLLYPTRGAAQQAGDYRSAGSGFWSQASIWQVFTEGSWVQATRPPSELEDIEISIEAGSTVTIHGEYISDQSIVIQQDAILIHTGEWEEYFNFFELHVYGRFVRAGEAEHGEFEYPNIFVHEGGVYEHNIDGGDLAYVEWLPGSVLIISGSINYIPFFWNKYYENVEWNCPNQSTDLILNNQFNNLTMINGYFIVENTNENTLIFSNGTREIEILGNLYIGENCNMSFNPSGILRRTGELINIKIMGNLIVLGDLDLQKRTTGSPMGNTLQVGTDILINGGSIFSTSSLFINSIHLVGGEEDSTKIHRVIVQDGYFGENITEFVIEPFNVLDLGQNMGFSIFPLQSFYNLGTIKGNDTITTQFVDHYPDAWLSPGNSIGSLVIEGNLDAFGGNVLIQIDGQKNDTLVIRGQAFFEGGSIVIEEIGEGMLLDFPYVVLFYEGLDTGDPNFEFPSLVFPTQDSLYTYEWEENKLIIVKEESFLPVRLQSFTAHLIEDKVLLHWETASEHDSDYFSIQRIGANNQWESIGSLKAKGFSETSQKYQFVDDHPPLGRVYYRLMQWDYAGTSQMYGPISVLVPNQKRVQIYPSLFQEGIWVYWGQKEDGDFSLLNLNGKTFYGGKWHSGLQWLALDHVPAGAYMLLWWDGNEKQSFKLWKP